MKFRNWFRSRDPRSASPNHDDEFEPQPLTPSEARELANREAKRDLTIDENKITYVAFIEALDDHCRVTIQFDSEQKGFYHAQPLPLEDRQEDETIDNLGIQTVAKSGRMLNAIRLYRLLHSADLAEAKTAIDKMTST